MKNLFLFLKIRYWLWKNGIKVTAWKYGKVTCGEYDSGCD